MGAVAVSVQPVTPEARPNEGALIDILERALHATSEWLFFRELRVGTGRDNNGAQRLDAFALNDLPHTAMKRVCYEVKTSRADFLTELKHPLKRRMGLRYSIEFYFVMPAGIVNTTEIPAECGLIEAGYATFEEWRQLMSRHAGFSTTTRRRGILHDHHSCAMARHAWTDVATRRGHAPAPTAGVDREAAAPAGAATAGAGVEGGASAPT